MATVVAVALSFSATAYADEPTEAGEADRIFLVEFDEAEYVFDLVCELPQDSRFSFGRLFTAETTFIPRVLADAHSAHLR